MRLRPHDVRRIAHNAIWVMMLVAGLVFGMEPHTGLAQDSLDYEPRFEPTDCRFDVPEGYSPECGDLIVPEDRSDLDGAWIRLHVAIFRSQSANPKPDPVIYLAGGGGHNHLSTVGHYLGESGDAILAERDYIHYNQRGADLNDPAVDCPGHADFLWSLAGENLSQSEHNAREIEFFLACRADLLAQGINLDMYNSVANAADARDLRIALGYAEANYFGTSYGTRLGLTLLREYPEGVRSMILDSVYPPQVDYYSEYTPNITRSFEMVFAACAADSVCSSRYPDIDATFYALIDQLNETPVQRNIDGHSVLITGNTFVEAMELMLYSPNAIGALPWMIDITNKGTWEPVESLVASIFGSVPVDINWAMFYSMQCHEEVPFESRETASALAVAAPPQIATYAVGRWTQFAFDFCDQWGVTPAGAIENEPVVSDVPVLVLAGGFDPATPPAWSQSAAEALTNSFYVEFPNLSHGVMRSDPCGLAIGLAFLDDPTTPPDTACAAEIPALRFQ
jgi:pimeloyl-ACP methyl ester carboxylesterase